MFKVGRSVRLVSDYALIGWDEGIYRHDVQRFYQRDAKGLPNMLLGIHVLLLAMAMNNNCGPPIKIVVATKSGVSEISAKHIADLENRQALQSVAGSDNLAVVRQQYPNYRIQETVTDFRDTVLLLHDNYVNSHVRDSFGRVLFDKTWKPDPVQEMPPGSVVTSTKEAKEELSSLSTPGLSRKIYLMTN